MRNKRLQLSAILLFGIGLTGLQAQTSVNTTGGNASGDGGSTSYSIGQVVYQNHTGTNSSMAEGVQQPYEISVVTAVDQAKTVNLSVTAYPNPTIDYLTLNISEFKLSGLSYQLFDMSGKLLLNEKITSSQTHIVMSQLVSASYLLVVKEENMRLKTFKIVKK
jgi:hypothetical protein